MLNNGPKVDEVLISAFAAVESAHAYSAFLPSIFTIRHFGHEPGTAKAIRDGELMGTLFALGLGAVISALIRSQMPVIFSAVTSVVMVSVYEYALKTRERPESLTGMSGLFGLGGSHALAFATAN